MRSARKMKVRKTREERETCTFDGSAARRSKDRQSSALSSVEKSVRRSGMDETALRELRHSRSNDGSLRGFRKLPLFFPPCVGTSYPLPSLLAPFPFSFRLRLVQRSLFCSLESRAYRLLLMTVPPVSLVSSIQPRSNTTQKRTGETEDNARREEENSSVSSLSTRERFVSIMSFARTLVSSVNAEIKRPCLALSLFRIRSFPRGSFLRA